MAKSPRKERGEHSAESKTQVVLKLLRGDNTLALASVEYRLEKAVIAGGNEDFLARAPGVFARPNPSGTGARLKLVKSLYKQQSQELAILRRVWEIAHQKSEKRLT